MATDRKYWPITENDVYVRLFNEILNELDPSFFDPEYISSFQSLCPESQYLVTRLYLRRPKWVRITDFENYMAIETLRAKVLPELVTKNWLLNAPPLASLISDVASQKELQEVGKSLGLKISNAARPQLAEKLIQLEKQQSFFNLGKATTKIGESLQIECYFLHENNRNFLFRLEQMFLFPVGPDATLEVVFLTHMKKQAFYKYRYVNQREAPLFTTKSSFEAYADARKICIGIEEARDSSAQKVPEHIMSSKCLDQLERGLEEAQKSGYTQAYRVYGRGFFNISQVFMKAHRFQEEYTWIQKYLESSGHRGKRGVALIRKLLLEIRFLEELGTMGESSWLVGAVNTYYDAIAEVSEIERIDLERKTTKLLSGIKNTGLKSALSFITSAAQPHLMKFKVPINEIIAVPVKSKDAPSGPGTRLTYAEGYDVERTALLQYQGYRGGHYENSMMLTILWLLCYDLMFSDPEQFRCAYHSHPMNIQGMLDMHKEELEKRMMNICDTVINNRRVLIKEYPDEPKPFIGGINWIINEKDLAAVIKGLGNDKTRKILLRITANYYKYSSGFPDLTLWHNEQRHTKFVEVKSEHDTVSDNQLLWMKFLLEEGVDVEICKVIPVKKPPKRKRK